jgi:hypothetical protein
MYKHEVKIGRSTPGSSSTYGHNSSNSTAGGAAIFVLFFYLIYKVIDLVIRPILVFLYRVLLTGIRYLYRNRRPIALAIGRTATTTYNYSRQRILTWRRLPTTVPINIQPMPCLSLTTAAPSQTLIGLPKREQHERAPRSY